MFFIKVKNIVLKNILNFFQWLSPDGFRSFVALVGTNGQGIGTSPLSRWVNNCESIDMDPQSKDRLDKFIDNLYEKLDKG